jgi:hypothetical protein
VIRPGSHAWALNEEQSQAFFKQALDLGINFWDTGSIRRVRVTVTSFLKDEYERAEKNRHGTCCPGFIAPHHIDAL